MAAGAAGTAGRTLGGHPEEWDEDPGVAALEAWSSWSSWSAPSASSPLPSLPSPPEESDGAERPRSPSLPPTPPRRPLPPLPLPPSQPGRPAVLATDPPAASGLTAEMLRSLAADAASRAFDLAHGGEPEATCLDLTMREDLARRAAALAASSGSSLGPLTKMAGRAGLSSRELFRWALAWEAGGREGLFVLTESWEPPPDAVAAGKALAGTGATAWRNRVSRGERQLRLGRDGRWYPYRRSGRAGFEPDGPPGGPAPLYGLRQPHQPPVHALCAADLVGAVEVGHDPQHPRMTGGTIIPAPTVTRISLGSEIAFTKPLAIA